MKRFFKTDELEIPEGDIISVQLPSFSSPGKINTSGSRKSIQIGRVIEGELKYNDKDGWHVLDGKSKHHIDEDSVILI